MRTETKKRAVAYTILIIAFFALFHGCYVTRNSAKKVTHRLEYQPQEKAVQEERKWLQSMKHHQAKTKGLTP